jgi:hypothetical protein
MECCKRFYRAIPTRLSFDENKCCITRTAKNFFARKIHEDVATSNSSTGLT